MEVIATDRPGATDTIEVTINVTDIDETPRGRNLTPLQVSFSRSSYSVDEGDSVTVTVTVSPASDRPLSVPVSASSSNAESGDYSVSGTPLSFASGDTSKYLTISTTSDPDSEDETVTLAFGNLPASVTTGTNATARVTIEESSESSSRGRRNTRSNEGGGGASFSLQQSNQPPEFTEGGNAQRTVAEDSAIPTNLGSPVSATDPDGDTLTYTLGGPDAAFFTLDSATGQLKTATGLDYETKASYFVILNVYDAKGGRDTIVVSIRVTDVVEQEVVVQAQEVVVQASVPTTEPQPVATPTPEPTAMPTPTPTAELTATPVPTPTPEPTVPLWPVRLQWRAPTATQTPLPTATPEPTPTLEPAATPDLSGDSQSAMFTQFQGGGPLGDFQSTNVKSSASLLPEEARHLRIWPIILMAIGIAMMVVSIGMLISGRSERGRLGNRDFILNS